MSPDSKIPYVDKRVSRDEDLDPGAVADATAPETEVEPTLAVNDDALAEAQQLAADRLDQLARITADYKNLRDRVSRDRISFREDAIADVVARLLSVIDNFELSVKGANLIPEAAAVAAGLALIGRNLTEALESFGVQRIDEAGLAFDPTLHEAAMVNEGDVEGETVTEVFRSGYRIGSRTLRPAMVVVTKPHSA